jgi:hypothetical protein
MVVVRKNQLLVRAAVMNCLARCSESSAPLCCLGDFLEQLARLDWHRDDMMIVERSVLEMLGKLREKTLATDLDRAEGNSAGTIVDATAKRA